MQFWFGIPRPFTPWRSAGKTSEPETWNCSKSRGRATISPSCSTGLEPRRIQLGRSPSQPWPLLRIDVNTTNKNLSDEPRLRRSEAQLQALVETAVDAIITIDIKGTVQAFNPAAERLLGYQKEEILGRNVNMIMPQPYAAEHDGYLRDYLETGVRRIIGIGRQVLAVRKDGSTFPADLSVSEIDLQECHLFTGVLRDISERRRLEKEVLEISSREQKRIGRDLHDGLGQELTGIAFLAEALHGRLKRENWPESERAGDIARLANQAIEHTRSLVKGLCPVNLGSDGLMIALDDLARQIEERHQLACKFTCHHPVLVHDHNTAMHVYYIAQEALTNSLRHGHPRHIWMSLDRHEQVGTLIIEDDGRGIEDDEALDAGRGLHIMRYRVDNLGGTLQINPREGGGTRVCASFSDPDENP